MFDDVQVWDLRAKRSVQTFSENYQVVAVAFAEAGDQVESLVAGIEMPLIQVM